VHDVRAVRQALSINEALDRAPAGAEAAHV
jgi:hypothetical protein